MNPFSRFLDSFRRPQQSNSIMSRFRGGQSVNQPGSIFSAATRRPGTPAPIQSTIPRGPTSSNSSAVSPAPAPIQAPTSPARTQYTQSLATPPSQGFNPASYASPSTTSSNSNNSQGAYIKYLTGMFDEKNVNRARKDYEKSQERLADIQSENERVELEARKGQQAILDRPGGSVAGAQQSAQVYGRRADDDLADRALQESAAARTAEVYRGVYDSAISAGKSVYEAEQAANKASTEGGFSLGEGERRFDSQGKEIAYGGPKTFSPGTGGGNIPGFSGTLSPLAQAVQNGTITIDKIPAAQRAQIAAELATSGIPTSRQQDLDSSLDVVNSLLENKALNSITGIPALTAFLPGTQAQLAKNQYDQLKGILSLENRQKLKGSGAISDFEFKVLSQAATALGRNLSNADFRTQLEKIKEVFEGKYAQTTATGPITNTVVMFGPGGSFNVPLEQVELFRQNGYQ